MTMQAADIQALRGLIEQSPALLEQLKQSKSMGDSAKVLAEAARQEGLPVDEAAMRAHLENAMQQMQSAALSDGQLDAVAGGQRNIVLDEGYF
jgi:urease accessory protein UreF